MKPTLALSLIFVVLIGFGRVAHSQTVRLSTVDPSIIVIANIQNYAAIIVEGALPETRKIQLLEGPGRVIFEKSTQRWLWNWQPSTADVGKSFAMIIKDRSGAKAQFDIQVKSIVEDRIMSEIKHGNLYSGIPTTIRMKQPGLDGTYHITLRLDDQLVADSAESSLTIKPALHNDVGKHAQIDVEYTSPLTGKPVTLASYNAKVKYPPFRTVPTQEIAAGEPIFFKAAMGVPPNFYTTLPSRVLIAKSDGYFQDTAYMFSGLATTSDDPFGMFNRDIKIGSGTGDHLCFDFGLQPTDKTKTITEKSGRIVVLSLTDPISKQTTEIEVRIFPKLAQSEE